MPARAVNIVPTSVHWAPVRFQVRTHALVSGQAPSWGHARSNLLVSLAHGCFALSLSKNK